MDFAILYHIKLQRIALLLILLLAAVLRLVHLGDVPNGLSNDEAGGIYNAYSLAKTGRDVTGNFLPLSINTDNSISPVAIYLMAPFVGILGPSPFASRLPFAIAGIISIYLLYRFTAMLTGSATTSLLAALVMTVSPWHLQVSRITYEPIMAVGFALAGFTLLLSATTGKRWFFAFLCIAISFYSYHATKLFLLSAIPTILFLGRRQVARQKRNAALFFLGMLTVVASFLVIGKTQDVSRQQVFFWNDTARAAAAVNYERRYNTAPWALRVLMNNKATYYARHIRENYLEAFSTNFLFLYGETGGLSLLYGTLSRGVLYLVELPLLFLGIVSLWSKPTKSRNLVFALLALAPVPAALTFDRSYGMRAIFMIPFLSILIAFGIAAISKRMWLTGALVVLYIVSVSSYLYQYHYRYPIYGAEAWFKSSQEVVEAVERRRAGYQHAVVIDPGIMFLLQYGVYTRTDPALIAAAWNSPWPKRVNSLELWERCPTATATTHAFDPHTDILPSTVYAVRPECYNKDTPVAVIRDLGEPLRTIWNVYVRD